jgi:hypothetical protein
MLDSIIYSPRDAGDTILCAMPFRRSGPFMLGVEKGYCVLDEEFNAYVGCLHIGDLACSGLIPHDRWGKYHCKVIRVHQIDITLFDHPDISEIWRTYRSRCNMRN